MHASSWLNSNNRPKTQINTRTRSTSFTCRSQCFFAFSVWFLLLFFISIHIFTFFSVPSRQHYYYFVFSSIYEFVNIFFRLFFIFEYSLCSFFSARLFHALVRSLCVIKMYKLSFCSKVSPKMFTVDLICCCPFEPLLTTISSHFFFHLTYSKYSLNISFFLILSISLFFLCECLCSQGT